MVLLIRFVTEKTHTISHMENSLVKGIKNDRYKKQLEGIA